jgi:cytochrome c
MACHSAAPGEHLTGPSLAHVWKRKAGTAEGFTRYSDALKRSGITWDETTLDRWLSNPDALVPGTSMTFPGIKDAQARQDVIAYLRALSENQAKAPVRASGGMMGGGRKPDLKKAPPEGQVKSIKHCGDAYTVETADGKREKVWEFNLRFKTDSSKLGPLPGKPVVLGAGMRGDRASVIFASPSEISGFIKQACD